MRFFRLTGALLCSALPLSAWRPEAVRRMRQKPYRASAILVLLAVLVLAWFFLDAFYGNVIKAGFFLRRPENVFVIAVLFSWLVCFFTGVNLARDRFSRPEEEELWRTLPVRPLERTLARFAVILILLLPVHVFLFLPALFVYLRTMLPDARWLAGAAAGLLLAPVPPAALALAAALLLRRFPRFSRRAVAGEIALLVAVVILLAFGQATLQNALLGAGRGSNIIFPVKMAIFINNLAETVPPARWLASVFRPGEEVLSLLAALGFGAAVAVPVLAWAVRTTARREDAFVPSRAAVDSLRSTARAQRPVFRGRLFPALVGREAKLLFARPPLVFEAVLRLLVLPAFLIFHAAAGPSQVTAIFSSFLNSSPVAAVGAAVFLLFLIDISFLAATGLSREGHTVQLSLSLPLDGALQAKAKTVFMLLLSLPPAALALALVYLLFPLPVETLVCAVPGIAAYLVFTIAIGLLFDYRRPVFDRSGAAFSQNATTVLVVALEAAVLAALGAVAGGAFLLGLSPLAAAFLSVELLAVADIILVPRLFRYASARQGERLELRSAGKRKAARAAPSGIGSAV